MEEVALNDRELKKLSRTELLEMLIAETKRTGELTRQVEELQEKLAERELAIENSGSMAEACLKLNGVFAAASAACSQYEENIRRRSEEVDAVCEKRLAETEQKCAAMLDAAEQKCARRMAEAEAEYNQKLSEAKRATDAYWNRLYGRLEEYRRSYSELSALMGEMGEAVKASDAKEDSNRDEE